MIFLTWNIQSGGGNRINNISKTLLDYNADVIVLTEFRSSKEAMLNKELQIAYPYIANSNPEKTENGLMIASKYPFKVKNPGIDIDKGRWLNIYFDQLDLFVLAVHIPGAPDHKFDKNGAGISGEKRKEIFWNFVFDYAEHQKNIRTLIIGDLNTGLREDAEGAMFKHPHFIKNLKDIGYIDSWRNVNQGKRDYRNLCKSQ
jgi:exodeoxyribonuclease-3